MGDHSDDYAPKRGTFRPAIAGTGGKAAHARRDNPRVTVAARGDEEKTEMRKLLLPLINSRVFTRDPKHAVYVKAEDVPRNIKYDKLSIQELGNTVLPTHLDEPDQRFVTRLQKILNETWPAEERYLTPHREILTAVLDVLKVDDEQRAAIMQHFDVVTDRRKLLQEHEGFSVS